MKRYKKQRVKQEAPDTSTSRAPDPKEHDLAYYIHDRVELMHQVFSVLKPKELKAIAPICVRHIGITDLQELCMEELLGISSKRLCAILDGADPPSDTESSSDSSPDPLETISLDSISSDEEILSQVSAKKSKKHKHSKKKKKSKAKDEGKAKSKDKEQEDKSRRAGLTVLELLELQARARAIRAQLQQEQARAESTSHTSEPVAEHVSDDEVEIKEEAAEVVEISSEDEKPNVQELEDRIATSSKETAPDNVSSNSRVITRKVNDLVITVPQTNTSRKIKLIRNTNSNTKTIGKTTEKDKNAASKITGTAETSKSNNKKVISEKDTSIRKTSNEVEKSVKENTVADSNDKGKSNKKKKRKKDRPKDKDGSDHDEITLQLSDTEKMDLLEDLEEKKTEKPSDTEDSSEDSDDESGDEKHKNVVTNANKIEGNKKCGNIQASQSSLHNKREADGVQCTEEIIELCSENSKKDSEKTTETNDTSYNEKDKGTDKSVTVITNSETDSIVHDNTADKNSLHVTTKSDIPLEISDKDKLRNESSLLSEKEEERRSGSDKSKEIIIEMNKNEENVSDSVSQSKCDDAETFAPDSIVQPNSNLVCNIITKESQFETGKLENINKQNIGEKSDGELSDRSSSEVEASDLKSDVVCISDDERRGEKKKRKKDKKTKKEKKCKKKKDFRVNADQNFYSETVIKEPNQNQTAASRNVSDDCKNMNDDVIAKAGFNEVDVPMETSSKISPKSEINNILDENVYEILELSDDSSCYDVEEISISKEPTTQEIQALSNKIDEIENNKAIDNDAQDTLNIEDLEHVSWKDRYLKSSKVKKVLSTANILNAMRKKNLELKQKLQESKLESEKVKAVDENISNQFVEGSIEQYNTLEGSTKYVDPVKEVVVNNEAMKSSVINSPEDIEDEVVKSTDKEKTADTKDNTEKETVTKEMKRDAKQLLKMYKMLLKYNDINKEKDSSKKKKKKKKSKEKDKNVAVPANVAT